MQMFNGNATMQYFIGKSGNPQCDVSTYWAKSLAASL